MRWRAGKHCVVPSRRLVGSQSIPTGLQRVETHQLFRFPARIRLSPPTQTEIRGIDCGCIKPRGAYRGS